MCNCHNSFDPGTFKTGKFLPITKANTYPMITYLPTYIGRRHLEVNCEVEILGVYRITETFNCTIELLMNHQS